MEGLLGIGVASGHFFSFVVGGAVIIWSRNDGGGAHLLAMRRRQISAICCELSQFLQESLYMNLF